MNKNIRRFWSYVALFAGLLSTSVDVLGVKLSALLEILNDTEKIKEKIKSLNDNYKKGEYTSQSTCLTEEDVKEIEESINSHGKELEKLLSNEFGKDGDPSLEKYNKRLKEYEGKQNEKSPGSNYRGDYTLYLKKVDLKTLKVKLKVLAKFILEEKGFELEKGLYIVNKAPSLDETIKEMLENAKYSEKKFFSRERYKTGKHENELENLISELMHNKTAKQYKTKKINAQKLSGRRIITGNKEAVGGFLNDSVENQLKKITFSNKMYGPLKWNKVDRGRSFTTKNGTKIILYDGNKETFSGNFNNEDIEIVSTISPMPGQIANMHTDGVGAYGTNKEKDILSVLNNFTEKNQEEEKKLAKRLLLYKKGKWNICKKNGKVDWKKSVEDINRSVEDINRIAFLVCFQEVYRRKNQGYFGGTEVEELPFGFGVSGALKLIEKGKLSMKEVFDKDADYGVFTGSSIMTHNLDKTKKKFNDLFSLIKATFAEEKYKDEINKLKNFIDQKDLSLSFKFSKEYFHQFLRESYGGESDSDGEDYDDLYDREPKPQQPRRENKVFYDDNEELDDDYIPSDDEEMASDDEEMASDDEDEELDE